MYITIFPFINFLVVSCKRNGKHSLFVGRRLDGLSHLWKHYDECNVISSTDGSPLLIHSQCSSIGNPACILKFHTTLQRLLFYMFVLSTNSSYTCLSLIFSYFPCVYLLRQPLLFSHSYSFMKANDNCFT